MGVERLTSECEMGLTEGFTLCRVGVNQAGDVGGKRLPVRDQLRFTGKLTHPGADHVNPDDRAIRPAYQLDEATSLQNL